MTANIVSFTISVMAGLFTGWLLSISKFLFDNKKNICVAIHSKLLWNTNIRVSISYLFKIKIDQKYLLIKGARIQQYQPVGGVFKMLESSSEIKKKFELIDDDSIPLDETRKDDLRVRLKGSHLVGFLKWYYSKKNREVGVHREFYEELIKQNILSTKSLELFKPEYLKTNCTPIQNSVHYNCKEILIYEIYEVKLESDEERQIKEYILGKNDLIILATSTEIEKECIEVNGISKKIGKHAKNLI